MIPVLWAALQPDGRPGQERLLVLDQQRQTLVVEGLPPAAKPPVLSLFRNFSAPITWDAAQSTDYLFALFAGDDDAFARWDAGQQLWKQLMLARAAGTPALALEARMLEALRQLLSQQGENDPAVLATLLAFPGQAELEALQTEADPPALELAACELREHLGSQLASLLQARLNAVASGLDQVWPAGQGESQLTGVIWCWLAAAGDATARLSAVAAVSGASMTLARSGLRALQPLDCPERDQALKAFHDRWQERPVIFDTWFALEASTPRTDALERVAALLEHPKYDPMAPIPCVRFLAALWATPGCSMHWMAVVTDSWLSRSLLWISATPSRPLAWPRCSAAGAPTHERQAAVKQALSCLLTQTCPRTRAKWSV